ncbi:MAG: tetratricopeptide repeat protein [Thaumarchaeota archaeon]|nr:tetratricopeptide repeat protein [Nitrososphaerota archaeon]
MSEEQLHAAVKLFLAKQFDDAVSLYDQILQKNPDSLDAINNKGYALGKLKKYADAIACYDLGLKLYPNEKTLLVNKISSLRKTKSYDAALEICRQVLNSNPDDNIALYHMERILAAIGNYAESIQCCDRILSSYPQNAEVLFDKAVSLAKTQSFQMTDILAQAISSDQHLKAKAKNHSAFAKYSTDQEFLRIVS